MATITEVAPSYAKAGDSSITLTGTGFVDDPSLTEVYRRKHGETTWEAIDPARVTFSSATEITIAIDASNTDGWDNGLNDIGVADAGAGTPDAYLAQALLFYLAVTGRTHARAALAPLLWGDVSDAAARANLDAEPEIFPNSPTWDHYGSWLRLAGRHHTRLGRVEIHLDGAWHGTRKGA